MGSATKTSICNQALSHVRAGEIDDYDSDQSEEAVKCRIHYPTVLLSVLEAHNWNFAKGIKALAVPSGEESVEWAYVYDYPVDCVKARYIVPPDEVQGAYNAGIVLSNHLTQDPIPFEVVSNDDGDSRQIHCNVEQAYLAYTRNIQDTRMFSAMFEEALAWKLATRLAIPFGGDSGERYRQVAANAYRETINEARALSGNERQKVLNKAPRSIRARTGNYVLRGTDGAYWRT